MRLINPYGIDRYSGGAIADRLRPARPFRQQAPIGGLNAREALEDMPPQDAIVLDNWFPDFGKVRLRGGSALFASTGAAGPVETLATLVAPGVNKIVAAADDKILDLVPPSTLGSGFTNARWQTATMVGLLGFVNGQDAPQTYDGTTLSAMTISGTGLTPADLDGIEVFKSRSYFWDTTKASFWYSAVDTLGGALTEFPLGNLGGIGGNLQQMITWTRDGGSGPDDYAVFIMTTGDVVIYAGNDPGDPANWALIGIYRIGAPVDVRGAAKVAGDVFLVTADGYIELGQLINFGRAVPNLIFSDKIQKAALEAVSAGKGSFGWQVFHYPAAAMLMFNYPDGPLFRQHVVNLKTGAWCRFTGLEARTWVIFNDRAYFGRGSGIVTEFDVGTSDEDKAIETDARQAFTNLRAPGLRKQLNLLKMLFECDGSLPIRVTVDLDYSLRAAIGELVIVGSGSSTSPWGSPWGSPWASGSVSREATLSRGGVAEAFSVRLRTSTDDRSISWNETKHLFQPAGVL